MEEKKDITPEECVKAGKCLMHEGMRKMTVAEYKNLSSEDKDKEDEKEVLEK